MEISSAIVPGEESDMICDSCGRGALVVQNWARTLLCKMCASKGDQGWGCVVAVEQRAWPKITGSEVCRSCGDGLGVRRVAPR